MIAVEAPTTGDTVVAADASELRQGRRRRDDLPPPRYRGMPAVRPEIDQPLLWGPEQWRSYTPGTQSDRAQRSRPHCVRTPWCSAALIPRSHR